MTLLTIKQGTDSGLRWQVNDGTTGLPFDFTNWSVRSQVRPSAGSVAVLHEFSTALGNATVGSDGYVTITWAHAETSAWTWTEAVWDLEMTSPGGKVLQLDAGRITVSREVTR